MVSYDPGALGIGTGDEPDISFQHAQRSLGRPDVFIQGDSGLVSLGLEGTLILQFLDNVIVDGPGKDLAVFKHPNDKRETQVWISDDNISYIPVGSVTCENPFLDIGARARQDAVYAYVKLRDKGDKDGTGPAGLGSDIDAIGALHAAMRLEIPADSLFGSISSNLRSRGRSLLDAAAVNIRKVPDPEIRIEVHTDSDGSESYNLMYSQRQADAIRNYFLDSYGIARTAIQALGAGETRPAFPNDTAANRGRNRRIEILVRQRF